MGAARRYGYGWRRPRSSTLGVSINILILVSIVVSITAITLFGGLRERQRGIEAAARDSVVWGVLQSRIEIKDFIEAIVIAMSQPDAAALDAVVTRYDVLYSRGLFLSEGTAAEHASHYSDTGSAASALNSDIMNLAPIIDAVAEDPDRLTAALPQLLDAARTIDEHARQLATASKSSSNESAVADRRQVSALYAKMAAAVVALVAVIGLIVILQGIQLRQIARAADDAAAGTRAKSAFLAAMSHEIRTPLNGIVGMTEILARSGLSPEQARNLAVIRQSGNLLLDVINDILDFSKVESGRAEIRIREFNLAGVTQTLRSVFLPRVERKSIAFEISAPDIVLNSDPSRLRQILVNLIGNALKFTDAGSIRLDVACLPGSAVRFEVRDTGIGIAPAALPRLFQEFSQVENGLARRYEGSGLGLAISRRLVEALGGRIGVESAPGRGSCFWFELPGVLVRETSPNLDASEALPTPVQRFHGHALVVEDNATNQLVTCGMLRQLGVSTRVAENGRRALDMISEEAFEIALIDVQMPILDGLETAREIRARGLRLPLVGLSANVLVSDRQDCFDAGMDDFLSKPVTLARLAEALEPWLPLADPDATVLPVHAFQEQRASA